MLGFCSSEITLVHIPSRRRAVRTDAMPLSRLLSLSLKPPVPTWTHQWQKERWSERNVITLMLEYRV